MKINATKRLTSALDSYDVSNDLQDLYDLLAGFLPDFEDKLFALYDAIELLKGQGQSHEASQATKAFVRLKAIRKELDEYTDLIDELALAVR